MKQPLLEQILERCPELTFKKIDDDYDKAVIGISERFNKTSGYTYHVLVYSLSKIIDIMKQKNPSSTLIDCLDDYNYNISGSIMNFDEPPVIVDDLF